MKRRDTLLGLAALACAPLRALAQPRLKRIALVDTSQPVVDIAEGKPYWGSLIAELRKMGHVEGKTVAFERWTGAGDIGRYAELARNLVATRPDLVVARGRTMIIRVSAVTQTIPIVAVGTIPASLRESLSRPGRNVTGIQTGSMDRQVYSKTAEIVQAITPKNGRAAWVGPRDIWESEVGAAAREGAARINLPLDPVFTSAPVNEAAMRDAFARVAAGKFSSVYLSPSTEFFPHRRLIVELAGATRLPTVGPNRYFAEEGLLVAFGADPNELWVRAAHYVDRILRGTPAGEIPIEHASTAQLVVNLKTAKATGVKIPASLLVRADRVIE